MRVVVADTSPVNYLILIDCIHLLPRLYSRIVVPAAVLEELAAGGAPPAVAAWTRALPLWVDVRDSSPRSALQVPVTDVPLDAGELAAIEAALAEPGALLIMDEAAGRAVATELGVTSTGTLGILLEASQCGVIDLKTVLGKLQNTNLRIRRSVIESLLSKYSD